MDKKMKLQGKTKQELIRARLDILRDIMEAKANGAINEIIDWHVSQIPYGSEVSNEYLKIISDIERIWIFIGIIGDGRGTLNYEFITIPFDTAKEDLLQVTSSFKKAYDTCIYVNPL
jgi:hypothetical protein